MSDGRIRLNLGCGDKSIDGFINIDMVSSPTTDVIADIRKLPFASGSVHEVMAIHVVEHFVRWEILDVLKEWVRVLRPNGRMVLECPDILEACKELLKDPSKAGTGESAQRTMWVFYGDPSWKQELMTHRWGYTPESLTKLMKKAGLMNIRREQARYKMKHPRDMRLIGYRSGT